MFLMQNDQNLLGGDLPRVRDRDVKHQLSVSILIRNPFFDPLAQYDAIRGRDADELGNAPDQVVFQFVALTIGVDPLPQKRDQFLPRRQVEMPIDDAGEGVKVDGVALGSEPALNRPSVDAVPGIVGRDAAAEKPTGTPVTACWSSPAAAPTT